MHATLARCLETTECSTSIEQREAGLFLDPIALETHCLPTVFACHNRCVSNEHHPALECHARLLFDHGNRGAKKYRWNLFMEQYKLTYEVGLHVDAIGDSTFT